MAVKTINDIIFYVDSLKNNVYPSVVKVGWINDVDGMVWNEIFKHKAPYNILRQQGVSEYNLPSGVDFSKITNVFLEDEEIFPIDFGMSNTVGYFRGTDGKVNIYPVPEENDTVPELKIIHLLPYQRKNTLNEYVLVDSPHDKIYWQYMVAMIDWFNKEYEGYNNSIKMFNASMEEFKEWYNERSPFNKAVKTSENGTRNI